MSWSDEPSTQRPLAYEGGRRGVSSAGAERCGQLHLRVRPGCGANSTRAEVLLTRSQ